MPFTVSQLIDAGVPASKAMKLVQRQMEEESKQRLEGLSQDEVLDSINDRLDDDNLSGSDLADLGMDIMMGLGSK